MTSTHAGKTLAALLAIASILLLLPVASAQTVPVPERAERTEKPASKQPVEPKQSSEAAKPAKKRVYQSACPAVLSGIIDAKVLPPIREDECGERSPLLVTKLSGIELSTPATMNCRMATSMATWLEKSAELSTELLKRRLKTLQVSTSYQCRRRNNAPTGKVSEHGFANAMDIVGFSFEEGSSISVEKHWGLTGAEAKADDDQNEELVGLSNESRFLRDTRTIACDHFSTVLSPESNAAHADHLHFDLGCHGKSCTYYICE